LDTADQVTLHRGRLLHTARQAALTLMPNYTPPPATANVYAAGAAGLAALQPWIEQHTLPASHSRVIATHLAHVLCGGDGTASWQDEQHFLDLERAAFIALLQTPATRARIHAMLTTGQPLQN
jgi:3-hydroxyacyl-CoA dehydrogenase